MLFAAAQPGPRRMAALKAVASPARQELISELGHAPASARELATRLGRTPQALHFHLGMLLKAGLVRVAGERGTGRKAERFFAVVPESLNLTSSRLAPGELKMAVRAAHSMLRLTAREISVAIAEAGTVPGRVRPLALRAKSRLSERQVARLHELIDEITRLFRSAKGSNPSRPPVAMTMVLTPARESGGKHARKARKVRA